VEISLLVLGVLFEKSRPDLRLRRWWARRAHALPMVVGSGIHRVPVPLAVAGLDARRLLLRPTAVLAVYVLARFALHPLPADKPYDGVNHLVGFFLAFIGLATLVLVASLAGRDRGVEIIEATPAARRTSVLSWMVLLTVLAVVEYAVLLIVRYARAEPPYGELLPDAWQLSQGPLMLLGGGLLGLVAARLISAWVAAPLLAVLSIAWVGTFSSSFGITMLAPVIEWIQYHEDSRVVVEPGSFAWHNAYLLGLCGLGIVAALMTAEGRRRWLVVSGSLLAVCTAAAGYLALP
jgi:hypothetical protein